MQTTFKSISIIFGFAILLAVLVANAFVTRKELSYQIINQDLVSRTHQVLYELSTIRSLIENAETGQRGYLYTGDLKYLAPYTAATTQIQSHIDSLAQLTAGQADEQARIPTLRNLVKEKTDELGQTISFYQAGKPDQARALVLSDVGYRYMGQIQQIIAEMINAEVALEATRVSGYNASIRGTIQSIYLSSFLAAIGLTLLAYYIIRQMKLREEFSHEIHAREEWFRVTLTSIGDAVIATDPEGRVTFLNPMAEKLTGAKLTEAKGRPIQEVFPIFNERTLKEAENPVAKVLALGHIVGLANHTVLRNVNGTLVPIEDSAAPIRGDAGELMGVVLVFRDVTHERKSEEVLRKTDKLASAARLSATMAHEINNPLAAVFNLIYVAKSHAGVPPVVLEQLTTAEQELERVAHITRKTLGFYRDSGVPEEIRLSDMIDMVISLYSHKILARNIKVERQFDDCPLYRCVPGEMKQAISNLISNAADAVDVGGTIAVRVLCGAENGDAIIQIVVEDDGPGIPAQVQSRIFEPFFTTKQDVGTGLGLWVTKGIVERHGGRVEARSRIAGEPDRGTIFCITLPFQNELESVASDLTASTVLKNEANSA